MDWEALGKLALMATQSLSQQKDFSNTSIKRASSHTSGEKARASQVRPVTDKKKTSAAATKTLTSSRSSGAPEKLRKSPKHKLVKIRKTQIEDQAAIVDFIESNAQKPLNGCKRELLKMYKLSAKNSYDEGADNMREQLAVELKEAYESGAESMREKMKVDWIEAYNKGAEDMREGLMQELERNGF